MLLLLLGLSQPLLPGKKLEPAVHHLQGYGGSSGVPLLPGNSQGRDRVIPSPFPPPARTAKRSPSLPSWKSALIHSQTCQPLQGKQARSGARLIHNTPLPPHNNLHWQYFYPQALPKKLEHLGYQHFSTAQLHFPKKDPTFLEREANTLHTSGIMLWTAPVSFCPFLPPILLNHILI